jgi:hypothetical protein
MEPLREASAAIAQSPVHLYAPKPAMRLRLGTYEGEARPPEVPHAANPPTGAVIDYWLGDDSSGPVTLTIYDAEGQQVRHFSSTDKAAVIPAPNYPDYFISSPNILPAGSGAHRFLWDLRYTPPAGVPRWGEPAVLGETPETPMGPLVLPGQYRVVLTVGGKEYSAPLTVQADPNADTTPAALAANVHFALALESDIDSNAKVLQAPATASSGKSGLESINRQLSMLLDEVVGNDAAPTPTVVDAANQLRASSGKAHDALTGMLTGH